jgi:hypothetical protein
MPVLSDLVTELSAQFKPEELKMQIEDVDKNFVLRRVRSYKFISYSNFAVWQSVWVGSSPFPDKPNLI